MNKGRLENIEKLNRARIISETKRYILDNEDIVEIKYEPETEYFEYDDLPSLYSSGDTNHNIVVIKNDSLGYVIDHISEFEGRRPIVLNFANPFTPGGGVRRGCKAQEEDICRRTNLLQELESDEAYENYYEINKSESNIKGTRGFERGMITKNVSVFVDSNGKLMNNPIVIDVLTVAAPYKYEQEDDGAGLEFFGSEDRIIEMILDKCEVEGYDDIILGAFGCGAFHNDPETISRTFASNLNTGKYTFKNVRFPIPVKSERGERNFEIFLSNLH